MGIGETIDVARNQSQAPAAVESKLRYMSGGTTQSTVLVPSGPRRARVGGTVGRNTMYLKRRVLYWTSRKPINGIRVATYGGKSAGVDKPVQNIDHVVRRPAQAVEHSRTRRSRTREIGELKVLWRVNSGGARRKSKKVALFVGHTPLSSHRVDT